MEYMSLAMLGAQALGTLTSAFAQEQQGQVAQQIATYNANIYNSQATQAQAEAAARAQILQRDNERKLSSTRAAYGASGVDVNQGTPLDVMADQATEAELQRQLVLWQGNATATALRQRAQLALMGGQAAESASDLAAGTTLATGGLRVGMGLYNLYGGKTGSTVNKIGNVGGSYGGYSGVGEY